MRLTAVITSSTSLALVAQVQRQAELAGRRVDHPDAVGVVGRGTRARTRRSAVRRRSGRTRWRTPREPGSASYVHRRTSPCRRRQHDGRLLADDADQGDQLAVLGDRGRADLALDLHSMRRSCRSARSCHSIVEMPPMVSELTTTLPLGPITPCVTIGSSSGENVTTLPSASRSRPGAAGNAAVGVGEPLPPRSVVTSSDGSTGATVVAEVVVVAVRRLVRCGRRVGCRSFGTARVRSAAR